jgi:hypothetical protein
MTSLIVAFQNFAKTPKNEGCKDKCVSLDTLKTCGRVEVQLHSSLTSAVDGGGCQ